jgi:hypothetical protein
VIRNICGDGDNTSDIDMSVKVTVVKNSDKFTFENVWTDREPDYEV